MAYVKTTWETGDVITAEKLNNMEGGIEASARRYGPYKAMTSSGTTIPAGQVRNITLSTITSPDGEHYYDVGWDPVNSFVASVQFNDTVKNSPGVVLRYFTGAFVDSEGTKIEPCVSIYNGTESAIDTSNFSLIFYADRPLEEYQPD